MRAGARAVGEKEEKNTMYKRIIGTSGFTFTCFENSSLEKWGRVLYTSAPLWSLKEKSTAKMG